MKRRVLVDTGPLVAFFNRRDAHHAWTLEQLGDIEPPLLTCEAVLSEACFLLSKYGTAASDLFDLLTRGLITTAFELQPQVGRVQEILERYADLPTSLADACLVRMAEIHAGSPVLTLDSDFRIYRIHGRKVIPSILPPA